MRLNEPSSIFFLLLIIDRCFCERARDLLRLCVEVCFLFLFLIAGFFSIVSETATCQEARVAIDTLLPIYVLRGIKRVLELAIRIVYFLLGVDLIFELCHLVGILLSLLDRGVEVRSLGAVRLPLCK